MIFLLFSSFSFCNASCAFRPLRLPGAAFSIFATILPPDLYVGGGQPTLVWGYETQSGQGWLMSRVSKLTQNGMFCKERWANHGVHGISHLEAHLQLHPGCRLNSASCEDMKHRCTTPTKGGVKRGGPAYSCSALACSNHFGANKEVKTYVWAMIVFHHLFELSTCPNKAWKTFKLGDVSLSSSVFVSFIGLQFAGISNTQSSIMLLAFAG